MSLKSQLSHLMPVAEACGLLGEDNVSRIVTCLIDLQQRTAATGGGGQQQQHSANDQMTTEDTTFLIRAMMYAVNPQTPSTTTTTANAPPVSDYLHISAQNLDNIPPPIRNAWNRLSSRPLMLDKLTLIKFLVPSSAQPHPGAGGHMGLFDCLTYALQTKPAGTAAAAVTSPLPSSPNFGVGGGGSGGGGGGPSLVGIPDIVIFLAICKQYFDLQHNQDEDAIVSFSSDHPTVVRMSQWMFLVYDAYQKKNMLQRDTLHRFLSDVYGEDCYKRPGMKGVLDKVFSNSPQVTGREFIGSISETLSYSPHPTHFLLDWMASLAHALMPTLVQAESTNVFLQTIDQQVLWLPRILDQYELAEHRLYEIKRRFHSMVETSVEVIKGDPMNVEEAPSSTNTPTSTGGSAQAVPKHSILQAAFERAVCNPSDELGHGGYLPVEIASKVFFAVANMTPSSNTLVDEIETETVEDGPKRQLFWDLTQVLQFGGICVRVVDDDRSLVKWILQLFGGKKSTRLTKPQVSEMVVLLCQHMDFRLTADNWYGDMTTHHPDDGIDENSLHLTSAKVLDLVPEQWEATHGELETTIPTQIVVDHLLDQAESTDGFLTLDQLMNWHKGTKTKDDQRLGPFIKELRLISSVLFGVPPKLASMEDSIIGEITRRHKSRYPQTEVSRRGPRGTVWYIIDDHWFRTWQGVMEKVSFTPEDGEDFRDQASEGLSPRRLSKISNRGLLRDNGSLALRVDIKWRSEYEIIPPLAWSALHAWYDGGPPMYRTVVPYVPTATPDGRQARSNTIKTENEIELYPLFVTMFLCDAGSRGEARPFQQGVPVSRVNPVRALLVQLCKGLDVEPDTARLWVMDPVTRSSFSIEEVKSGEGDWMLELDLNIVEQRKNRVGDHGSSSNINLLLELKDEESGLWPRGIDGNEWSFNKNDPNAVENGDGIVGLYNMGNTCYLNASIQCLSHTPIFRDYFNSKWYLNDINTTNPLGYEGRLAQVSAVLINSLWKRFNQQTAPQPKRVTEPGLYAPVNAPALTPKTFKESLGKFNELFAGNEQHDAQELLAFLLGGLSEDLNRIQDKPYIQAPDSDGRPDNELADIWWSNHLKREMSIIVALFTGQYKSLLKCKSCKYESARFEPFSFLSVPLPEDDTIPVSLILYPKEEGDDSLKYSVRVQNNGTLYDVLLALAKILHADEQEKMNDSDENGDVPALDDTQNDAKNEELEAEYAKRASNMAVVDMREGYIFKIAPNSWRLPDLQNKDSGELPLLHVYTLDPAPMPVEMKAEQSNDEKLEPVEDPENDATKTDGDETSDSGPKVSFLALAQRRSELISRDVLHPLSHGVFGTPLLLRVPYLDKLTGAELYDFVASRLRTFVPPAALKFLESDDKATVSSSKSDLRGTGDSEGKEEVSKKEKRQNLQKTFSDMEEVAAGPVPRYGFRLRLASRDGRRCSLCPWYECCIGCLIPDDDAPTVAMCGDSIVIDWHFAVDVATNGFGSRGQVETTKQSLRGRAPGMPVKNHSSATIGSKKGYAGAITLEDCLDAFAEEEKIPEAYCSKCKDFRVATKRMSLWRLPPVVIIQLKRFQFTQHSRRKLRDFVHFPVEGLDLSRIMAEDTKNSQKKEESTENPVDGAKKEDGDQEDKNSSTKSNNNVEEAAADTEEMGGSRINDDDGRKEMLYDLYGVVHHQGALTTGHYVASLKSELDGQWRLFNDAQIYEIHSRDVVDSSAYILFYIRRDVKDLKLSDFWNVNEGQGAGLTEEEMDNLIHGRSDRCVIS